MLKYAKINLINNLKEKLNMKGYGIASWLRKEEYRNYFVSANYQPEDDGTASIRLNKFANNLTNGWD